MASSPAHAPTHEEDQAIDRGFGMAIMFGACLGIILLAALIGVLDYALTDPKDLAAAVAVGVWTGIWGGLFLGGTITVGLWSHRNFH